ncbi:hypothetical protein LCGC14_2519850 [marine sediment metagenome]|uniref:Uncharacterized protein n=1 Tax=marine sediment metagenome TaxID=412755 RepID=A0A0F9D896_9ZZZZ
MTLSEYLNLEEETIQGIQRAIEAEAVREWEILGKELACERKVEQPEYLEAILWIKN